MMERTPRQERNRVLLTGPLILFDGVCNLCNGSVRFLLPRDRTGRLRFAPIQSEAGQSVLRRHGLPLEDWNSFVLLDDGRIYLKAEALCRITRFMRRPWRLAGTVLKSLPKSAADRIYDLIATNRYALFGRRDQCMVPSEATRDRFVG
ncbi:MAG TPA: thiol-disulfide oxidoreductase DCC family protein [Aliidongia sp.]|uniref:thiol-disulfide oxidoreductase DCC family protein n=1 Tax=Aliidongia sp. TaxID=1914230 RepID=UPI002DDD4B1F|nr:thiol-disulfide oxidoreductase DCC family protein [Aliidongia sp.]HEV2678792.1 thiol-disulfide oxidoreductase DCC family protein [Aliidongia sp.]